MKNIVLIGMPGCGKSTMGVILAKALGYGFVDADLVIQNRTGKLLCEIIAEEGLAGFLKIEDEVNSSIDVQGHVIATGGSVVYCQRAMERYTENDIVVYIKLPYEEIEHRLGNIKRRGVVLAEGQTLADLYDERVPLYEKYAHIVVDATGLNIEELLDEIATHIERK